ncbi:tyrosine-type recombinase/integrase [Bradyrhizobium sp. USDA 4508]
MRTKKSTPNDINAASTLAGSDDTNVQRQFVAILLHPGPQATNGMSQTGAGQFTLFSSSGARKYLTLTERRRFRRAIQDLDPTRRRFCVVLMLSGGRISEVLALTPAAVDLDGGTVALMTLKRRKRGVVREIPLPRSLLRELAARLSIREKQRDPERAQDRLWPWSRTTAWRLVKMIMVRASIVSLAASPKGLRHTFGVSAFQAKVPPHLVQRWLGHASLRTTSIYGEVIDEEERQFALRMWRRLQ